MSAISWQSIAIAALIVGGIACCGIAAICILAADKVDDGTGTSDRIIGSGISLGFIGMLLLAAAFGVRAQ
jgi:hypothetical protein